MTQVASASEGGVFHNRLTHSIKVAQVARRVAELLLASHSREFPELANFLDADVVEAAALAHDLGHPPFGHVADKSLCSLAESSGLQDGFEGNAQTFRIATRLSVRKGPRDLGMDLTRATLAAIAKYPWLRARGTGADRHKKKKFSFFDDDKEAGDFALKGVEPETKTLECQVMDLADGITYSVHDLEDFYRAGLVPVERLVRNEDYRLAFLKRWKDDAPEDESQQHAQDAQNWREIRTLLLALISDESEPGTRSEAALLDSFRSVAISKFVGAVEMKATGHDTYSVQLRKTQRFQSKFLQRLIWDYVILSPRLATQQAGQLRIVEGLFQFFREALKERRIDRLPTRFRDDGAQICERKAGEPSEARFAIDIVATLTEAEATSLYKRIGGHESGSILDLIH